jgi:hypothetical protein
VGMYFIFTKMLTFMVDHTHIQSIFIGDQGIEDASTYSTSSVRISHTCVVPYCLSLTGTGRFSYFPLR